MTSDSADPLTRLTGAAGALHGLVAVAALAASVHLAGDSELMQRGGQLELYHALAVFAALCVRARLAAVVFAAGAALFAAPLYVHALWGSTALVFLAPIGGTTLLIGWAILLWGLLRPSPRTA